MSDRINEVTQFSIALEPLGHVTWKLTLLFNFPNIYKKVNMQIQYNEIFFIKGIDNICSWVEATWSRDMEATE